MTPLGVAWANLVHKRARTFIAAAGVAFAVILIFMELGMLGGVGRTATQLYDKLQFDLIITSGEYLDLSRPSEIPRERLTQARAVQGVEEVNPLSIGVGSWRLPARERLFGSPTPPGGQMSISILAVPPDQLDRIFVVGQGGVFASADEIRAAARNLGRLDTFLIDRRSKPEFGTPERLAAIPPSGRPVVGSTDPDAREMVRLNGRRAEIVGGFDLGTGFSWNGMLLTNEESFARFTGRTLNEVNFGLVRLKPGSDPQVVKRALLTVLPHDVKVYTRDELNAEERRYWLRLTSVGQFLVVAVVLAVVVGGIFVYQMMAADIRNMIPEYATVKALGYRSPYLSGIVLWQAVLLALFGYIPGFLAALGLYEVARSYGGIPTEMTVEVATGVLALTLVMCLVSGLLAVRKVQAAQPADLF